MQICLLLKKCSKFLIYLNENETKIKARLNKYKIKIKAKILCLFIR